jgi:tRNA(fMet)-specific endonuclease VapC
VSPVLVDTSAWIDFFRGERLAVARVDPLLAEGEAAVCGPTFAEVVSGAPSPREMQRLQLLLRALEWLEPPDEVWERVAAARFALARAGIQTALVDVLIALTAAASGATLLTRDRGFLRIQKQIPLQLELF